MRRQLTVQQSKKSFSFFFFLSFSSPKVSCPCGTRRFSATERIVLFPSLFRKLRQEGEQEAAVETKTDSAPAETKPEEKKIVRTLWRRIITVVQLHIGMGPWQMALFLSGCVGSLGLRLPHRKVRGQLFRPPRPRLSLPWRRHPLPACLARGLPHWRLDHCWIQGLGRRRMCSQSPRWKRTRKRTARRAVPPLMPQHHLPLGSRPFRHLPSLGLNSVLFPCSSVSCLNFFFFSLSGEEPESWRYLPSCVFFVVKSVILNSFNHYFLFAENGTKAVEAAPPSGEENEFTDHSVFFFFFFSHPFPPVVTLRVIQCRRGESSTYLT